MVREPIRVAVIFGPNRVRPVWFDWGRTWREQAGEALLFHFAVSDGAILFELRRRRPSVVAVAVNAG